MIKSLLKASFLKFGNQYNYDTTYMQEVADISTSAGLRLSFLPFISQYRAPDASIGVWAGSLLASTLSEDCGPCAQLIVDMALEVGVNANHIEECISGQAKETTDAGLGFIFASKAISKDLKVDEYRKLIIRNHCSQTLLAASFAASSGRVYPVLKRALGHGAACLEINVNNKTVKVERAI